jgi:hypothetical protein
MLLHQAARRIRLKREITITFHLASTTAGATADNVIGIVAYKTEGASVMDAIDLESGSDKLWMTCQKNESNFYRRTKK